MKLFLSKITYWKNRRFLKNYQKKAHKRIKSTNPNWALIIPTIIVAAASVCSVYITWEKSSRQIEIMQGQVDEMKKATELDYRPYLIIDMLNASINLQYYNNDSILIDEFAIQLLDTFELNNIGPGYFSFSISRDYKNKNVGKSPLWVVNSQSGIIGPEFWSEMQNKPLNKLINNISQESDSNFTSRPDFIILPYDSAITHRGSLSQTFLQISDKAVYRQFNEEMIFYYYNYIEYEDFLKNKYSIFFVVSNTIELKSDRYSRLILCYKSSGIEKFRWDIFPSDTLR